MFDAAQDQWEAEQAYWREIEAEGGLPVGGPFDPELLFAQIDHAEQTVDQNAFFVVYSFCDQGE